MNGPTAPTAPPIHTPMNQFPVDSFELGRYPVREAGVYACRVIDRKVSRGHTYPITDGGLHHNLSASASFGQLIRKNCPLAIVNRMGGPAHPPVSAVGPLCTPLELIADRMPRPSRRSATTSSCSSPVPAAPAPARTAS